MPLNMEIRAFLPADREAVIRLWVQCGLVAPYNNPELDIARKLAVTPDWLLVGTVGQEIVASCMVGYDGHRGWINYLAVAPEYRRRGLATKMMDEAERLLRNAGCAKVNLQVRVANQEVIAFYRSIGYSEDQVRSMGKRLVSDPPYDAGPL